MDNGHMVEIAEVGSRLQADIQKTGYYPALVSDSLATALGGEAPVAYAIQHEATFDRDELRRHITVLALTATRMIMAHVDEHGPHEGGPTITTASASTEAVRLERVDSVVVTRIVADPANYIPESAPSEVILTIGWGAVNRIELEPATCGDPSCEADHGFSGSSANDDLSLRVSAAADGESSVTQLLSFAESLSEATAARLT